MTERTMDAKTYERRHYRLRFVGGPYDHTEINQTSHNAPPTWHFAGAPSEWGPRFTLAAFRPASDFEEPPPHSYCVRVDYQLVAVFEDDTFGRIAIYMHLSPSTRSRYRVVENQ